MQYDKTLWRKSVSKVIRVELKKNEMTYANLVQNLRNIGVEVTEVDLRSRVSKGNFSSVLFVQCLLAMGLKNINLSEYFANLIT